MYEVKRLRWDKSRDYLLSQIISFQANRYTRSKQSDKFWMPEDFLALVYPDDRRTGGENDVTVTQNHDPDRGALGNWRALRAGLKGMSQAKEERNKNLKPFTGNR